MAPQNKVLIIDDEMDSCLLWKAFLTQLQFEVYTALTLRDGLRLVDDVQPAIIFLDNNLPDGLGWENLDAIQQKLPFAKVILVSAYQFDSLKWQRENVKVMEKPINLSAIKALLLNKN